jgi:hypothetical protein
MIPRDEDFDVYVSEGALVEVWRGEHLTVAQQFAEDWDGPIQSVTNGTTFRAPRSPVPADNPMTMQQLRAIVRRGALTFGACVALGAGVGALLGYGMAHGWWW